MSYCCRKIICAAVAIICMSYHQIHADEPSAIFLKELLICPIGWQSEREIAEVLGQLDIEVIERIEASDDHPVISAPISGNVKQQGDMIILEDRKYRIYYPRAGLLLSPDRSQIEADESLIRLEGTHQVPFVLILRKSGASFNALRIPGQGVEIPLKEPTKVFAANSGSIYYDDINIMLPDKAATIYSTTSDSTEYESTVIGVGDYIYKAASQVRAGQQIGMGGIGENSNVFNFHLWAGKEVEPFVIYVELIGEVEE